MDAHLLLSYNKEQRHGLAQPPLGLTCGLTPWLDLCLITTTLPGAPDSWLNLAVVIFSLLGGGGTSPGHRGPALVT